MISPPSTLDLPPVDLSFSEAPNLDFDRIKPASKREAIGRTLGLRPGAKCTAELTPKQAVKMEEGVKSARDYLSTLPASGQATFALMDGTFTGWQLIEATLKLIDKPVEWLGITTLGANTATALRIRDLMQAGTVRKCAVVLSSYFEGADREECARVRGHLEAAGVEVAVARSHSKLALIQPAKGRDRFVILGSQNLWSCNCVEAFVLTNSAPVFEFYTQTVHTILRHAPRHQ